MEAIHLVKLKKSSLYVPLLACINTTRSYLHLCTSYGSLQESQHENQSYFLLSTPRSQTDTHQNDISITTHRGNEVSKSGTEDDPAVKVSIGGKPVARQAHELTVEKEGPNHDKAGTMTSTSESGNVKPSQEASGEKIAAEKGKKTGGLEVPKGGRGKSKSKSPAPEKKEPEKKEEKAAEPEQEKETEKKEEKKEAKPAAEKKKPGRKPGAAKDPAAPKKEKTKKRAATEDGEPRRSKRTKA